ncbi:MAG: BlaI/MecI/CopY family transcriptional regulator [Thermoplasmata archaeon]
MLGSLEMQVISVLKTKGFSNGRGILNQLRKADIDIAYTTVSTVLFRLYEKGLVERKEERYRGGKRYIYFYKNIETEYVDSMIGNIITTFGKPALAQFLERVEELSREELEELKEKLGI